MCLYEMYIENRLDVYLSLQRGCGVLMYAMAHIHMISDTNLKEKKGTGIWTMLYHLWVLCSAQEIELCE